MSPLPYPLPQKADRSPLKDPRFIFLLKRRCLVPQLATMPAGRGYVSQGCWRGRMVCGTLVVTTLDGASGAMS